MRRREFIALVGRTAVAWPLAVRAQQSAMPVVGLLGATTAKGYAVQLTAFQGGLNEIGYVEGQNAVIEYRWAEDQYDRLPRLAADLVHLKVTVIVAMGGNVSSLAAKSATATIPIVFHTSVDPVKSGLVASLNRPGGNLTGVFTLNTEIGPKRLELLHAVVRTATTFCLLVNPTNLVVTEANSKALLEAARNLGLRLHILHASTERDFETVFASVTQLQAGGLVIGTDGLFVNWIEQLAALSLRHAVPTIFQYRTFAAAGGLLSYGDSGTESYRLVGLYTGRILKGEKATDLPVQEATKIELIINLKTAKALNLAISDTLLARADEVIE